MNALINLELNPIKLVHSKFFAPMCEAIKAKEDADKAMEKCFTEEKIVKASQLVIEFSAKASHLDRIYQKAHRIFIEVRPQIKWN